MGASNVVRIRLKVGAHNPARAPETPRLRLSCSSSAAASSSQRPASGTQIGVFRLALLLPRHVTLFAGHFGNSGQSMLRNHGTSDDRTLTTPRAVARRVAWATSQGRAVAVREEH